MDELSSACRTLQKDLAEDSRLMLSELCSALAPLRVAAAKPDAPASAGTLLKDIEKLLRGEKEPDYVSLDRLMNTLLEQYPALQAVSGSMPSIDSSKHELLPERMSLGMPETPRFSEYQTGMEMQTFSPVDPEPAPPEKKGQENPPPDQEYTASQAEIKNRPMPGRRVLGCKETGAGHLLSQDPEASYRMTAALLALLLIAAAAYIA
jgi:hypothetical protein